MYLNIMINQNLIFMLFLLDPKKNDSWNTEVKNILKFIDINNMSDEEVANTSQKEIGIDIAIDLCGFTAWNRAKIFFFRAAPIQINYLGYPGTMGSDFMDYILSR